jgi:hypothetical protein
MVLLVSKGMVHGIVVVGVKESGKRSKGNCDARDLDSSFVI